jgi:hypothetical protein
MFVETLFLVLVLIGLGSGIWSMFAKKSKTPPTSPTLGGGGGTFSGGSGQHTDGSVTPPSTGENAQ